MLREGSDVPGFSLRDDQGDKVTDEDLEGTTIIYFYPKDDTPGCTKEACNFRDAHEELKDLGVSIYGVSTDTVKSHEQFSNRHDLTFPLLADPDGELAEKFGVYDSKYKGETFASRKTFIVEDGKVIKAYNDVDPETHIEEVNGYLNG